MSSSSGSKRPRGSGLLAATSLLAAACASPLGGRELDLSLSARASPGFGAGLAFAQRMLDVGSRRIDLELGLEHQELDEAGPEGDDWARVWTGLRCAPGEPRADLQGRAGFTWLRSDAGTGALEVPGDYGGVYAGLGWTWELAPALATGPELTVLYLDSEGDRGGSGAVAELAWTWTWRL